MERVLQYPGHQQPTLPEALQPEATSLDKWFTSLSEPIRITPRFLTGLQTAFMESLEPIVIPPEEPDIDVGSLLSPVPHWRRSYGVA